MDCFQPKIIAFCCEYCGYAAADLAGILRLDYPEAIRIIRVPCTGKVDVLQMLRAIQKGADGVFLAGCLEGSCHFVEGNIRAAQRVRHVQTLLKEAGIEEDRVRMYNLSSSDGHAFAAYAKEMTENVLRLGPNPLRQRPCPNEKP